MKKTWVTLLCVTVLAGCSTAAKPTDQEAGPIKWGPCVDLAGFDGQPTKPDPAMQCGTIPVPLDYAEPDGEQIDMALIRTRAVGSRLGSLVFNFGGPGVSGVDNLSPDAFSVLGSRYDLVGFDPRGVERSAGVRCGGQVGNLLASKDGPQAERLLKEFADACRRDSGKVLPHVGTVNAARDLDRIRAALGDERLNYFGFSYGTHLGAVYATRFPKKVGRFVLDAPFDPTVSFGERAVTQAAGFGRAFAAFAEDCVARGCELGDDPGAVKRAVENLVDGLKSEPLKVGDRMLTYGLAQLAVLAALYSEDSWSMLEEGAATALKGDGSTLLELADLYTGRKPDGGYSTAMSSLQAVNCADTTERPTAAQVAEINRKIEKIFPFMAGDAARPCAYWPVPGSDEAKKIDATGSAPIVVIGGKGDPATPYKWATALDAQLKTGVLVTYEGGGHGAYNNACVTRVVDKYLLDGQVPAEGTTCPAA
ncbi:alpha/beta hydrolase [Sinosporangium siamense]|nr:alpha/beta hydrolase [Sinosporangium siamense]